MHILLKKKKNMLNSDNNYFQFQIRIEIKQINTKKTY